MSSQGLNRRYFFFGSLLAGAIPSGGYGTVKSLRALGYKPYYDKLNVAAIGCGGRGGRILNEVAQTENIVALCDVDEKRAAENFQRYGKQPKYADFRVMLEKQDKNIDACTIGIPDHMHAATALACMQAGKHVYLEKPLTRTPWEARLMVDAAKKYGVATQMGNQGYSHESIRATSEILWSGEIGDVREVHASSSPGTHPVGLTAMPVETSVPAGLNWDLWLGGADMRSYNPTFTPYNWRGYFDFGTGQLGNWGIHVLGPVNMALQLGAPTSVELLRQVDSSQWTFPTRAVLRYDFPARGKMPPVSVYWHDSPRPTEEEAYRVPGMEEQTILPSANNLSAKGRGPEPPPSRRRGPRAPRTGPPTGAGGPGVAVYGYERRGDPAQPGVLSSNGAVFCGIEGHDGYGCTRGRRASAARRALARLRAATAALDAIARPHERLGARLQRRRSSLFGFPHLRALHRMGRAGRDRVPRSGQARLGQRQLAVHQQRRSKQVCEAIIPKGGGS